MCGVDFPAAFLMMLLLLMSLPHSQLSLVICSVFLAVVFLWTIDTSTVATATAKNWDVFQAVFLPLWAGKVAIQATGISVCSSLVEPS